MNRHDDLDRMLSAWLDDPHVSPAPRYLDDILDRTRRTRQRPAWASLERWLPMTIVLRTPVLSLRAGRLALGLVLLLALLLTLSSLPFLAGALVSPSRERATMSGLIAFDRDGDIYVVDAPDGEPRLLIGGSTEDVAPSWSPDGRSLLFMRANGAQETLMVTDANGRSPTVVNPEPLWETSRFLWSPDSTEVAVASAVGGAPTISFFAADGSGEIAFDRGTGSPWKLADMPAWRPTADGTASRGILYRSTIEPPTLQLVDEGAVPELVLSTEEIESGRSSGYGWTYDFLDPTWSPDGEQLAYHTLQDLPTVPGDPGFRVHGARPGDGTALASDALIEYDANSADEFGVSWSPDGSMFMFQAYDPGSARLVIHHPSPRDQDVGPAMTATEALPASDWHSLGYAWAPDGSSIVLVNFGAPDRDAYLVDPQTGALEPLGWSADGDPSWQAPAT